MSNADNGTNSGIDAGLERLKNASPFLLDIRPACEVIPTLSERDFLHAGPPLEGWHEACGALRGAVIGTILHAGTARNIADAEAIAAESIRLVPAQEHNALGTFGGIIARQTPVLVVRDQPTGTLAFAALNEGRGKAMRYGSYDTDTLARLSWMETDLAQMLGQAIRLAGGVDLFEIMSQALHMGDDCHSRQRAGSALFVSKIAPFLSACDFPAKDLSRVFQFLSQNDFFFLPLAMAAAKSALASVEGMPGSALVTCMAFNGVRCGIRVSGHGKRWWTAPVNPPQGQYFQGYSQDDAGPIIGDSEITETMGLGAFAMAGAPVLARYVGGTIEQATRFTLEMYKITAGEHPRFTIPALGFRGAPFGIDARSVVQTGIEPIFNTGIAHRVAGVGQIGAGYSRAPIECFRQAIESL
ncbi:MAG TPA: DUF1116 domain-containing protein [Pseudolabrys sp.]|nr:DUF1116 domain-containing protein [Pseudolabrys sp.]